MYGKETLRECARALKSMCEEITASTDGECTGCQFLDEDHCMLARMDRKETELSVGFWIEVKEEISVNTPMMWEV